MKNHRLAVIAVAICSSALIPSLVDGATCSPGGPVGEEFQINTVTTGSQHYGEVAMAADGGFVVVWSSSHPNWDVRGQRFDQNGAPLGPELGINAYTSGTQSAPSVAVSSDGSFVATWMSFAGASMEEVSAQRFSPNGEPRGSAIHVSGSYTSNVRFWNPSVDVADDGSFVIVWNRDVDEYPHDPAVSGRRFASDGSPLGEVFLISQAQAWGWHPSIEGGSDNSYIVVWNGDSIDSGDPDGSIQARMLDSSGTPTGVEFRVNSYTTGYPGEPSVDADADGNFVVVWADASELTTIRGQHIALNGNLIGAELLLHEITSGAVFFPSVGVLSCGEFVVTWVGNSSSSGDTSGNDVEGRLFNSSGSPLGFTFQVNTYTTGNQSMLNSRGGNVSTGGPDGDFVVVWPSSIDNDEMKAQRYSTRLFADGFEVGDTANWSAPVS